jgi:xeroderma pigmentosum group C-complementing protein
MPPFLPRKRLRSDSPPADASKSKGKGKAVSSTTPRKQTLFDALDAGTSSGHTAEKTKNLLAKLAGSDDDESSLSSLSSSELDFEDVPVAKRQKTVKTAVSDDDEDEDVEFEDIKPHAASTFAAPPPSGDLDLTLTKETRISLTNPHNKKQGPSKIERQIRVSTHCMHVQFLLWHNWIRNGWISDKEVQQILVKQLGPNAQKEIERWRMDSGLTSKTTAPKGSKTTNKKKGKKSDERSQRDWGEPAQRLAAEGINMSHGDPLFKLMRALSAYWKKRFRITAPGLRKTGYMSLSVLDEELKSFSREAHDPERHGERVRDIKEFRECAKTCEGSRDLSAQLFTALLRGIGLEARMVVSLQPVGFGWSKNEEAVERSKKGNANRTEGDNSSDSEDDGGGDTEQRRPPPPKTKAKPAKTTAKPNPKKADRRSSRGSGLKEAPIDVSDSESPATDNDNDDDSIVDVTPATPRRGPSKVYENDLPPNYWIEVMSPITNTYYAVNPLNVGTPVATNAELLASFEPRGIKSEKAKQVMAYVVGLSPDGTAKDVTVRYLKRHMWPGKTKGFRIPVEKVPVYNHRGKIKRHEEYDWFKTVMSRYGRSGRQRTYADDQEEATDLKAAKPEKKEAKEGEETLQTYKSSAEFVLERHLRREEALLPKAKPVKMFLVKGKKGEESTEEKVFLRKDVVHCKSVETWHKEGREPIIGEQPLKRVPYRAATTNRKREIAEAEAASGEKMLQGLYSRDQTDWIIPPPIVDGRIPKNGYGNIDVYVPSMVPEGAVHIPRRRTKEICRKLGIDYAEAVTGFEFGARMAIPIITGVVIAEENEEMVMEQWERDEAERARKEDEKRTRAALGMWRKFLMGLRIVERVREEYGDDPDQNVDALNPWINKNTKALKKTERIDEESQRRIMEQNDEDMAGGFLPEGRVEEEIPQSFFPTRHEDEDDDDGGGFIVEGHEPSERQQKGTGVYPTPISMQSDRRTQVEATDDSEEEEKDNITLLTPAKHPLTSSAPKKAAEPALQAKNKPTAKRKGKSIASGPSGHLPRTANKTRKRKHSSDDDKDEEPEQVSEAESSLSDSPLLSDDESAPPPQPAQKRRATLPAKASPSQRAVPKRKAARKSETALRSHYFAHSEDEDEDE